jgi:hypothetical protein
MSSDPIAVTAATLDEIARAIGELSFQREFDGAWPELEPETKALVNLFHERVALMGRHVDNLVCELAALLMLEAMVAQHLHDSRSQPPFGRTA